jgi:hypothetical protein
MHQDLCSVCSTLVVERKRAACKECKETKIRPMPAAGEGLYFAGRCALLMQRNHLATRLGQGSARKKRGQDFSNKSPVLFFSGRSKSSATPRWQFSSRWNRIVRGMGLPLPGLCLKQGRQGFRPHLGDKLLPLPDSGVDLVSVLEIGGQGSVDLGEGSARVRGYDFVRALGHAFVPDFMPPEGSKRWCMIC